MKIIIIIIIGIVFLVFGIKRLVRLKENKYNNRVEIEIKSAEIVSDIESIRFSRIEYYYPKVSYSYSVHGKNFNSSVVAFDKKNIWVDNIEDAKKMLNGIIHNRWAYYNSKNISDSVILKNIKSERLSHNYMLVVVGIILIIFATSFM